MAKMIQADPHFIRCIRPNSKNVPGFFDQQKVLIQLRYTGVLETSKIRRQVLTEIFLFSVLSHFTKCLLKFVSMIDQNLKMGFK